MSTATIPVSNERIEHLKGSRAVLESIAFKEGSGIVGVVMDAPPTERRSRFVLVNAATTETALGRAILTYALLIPENIHEIDMSTNPPVILIPDCFGGGYCRGDYLDKAISALYDAKIIGRDLVPL